MTADTRNSSSSNSSNSSKGSITTKLQHIHTEKQIFSKTTLSYKY